jgi:hypothetical protein
LLQNLNEDNHNELKENIQEKKVGQDILKLLKIVDVMPFGVPMFTLMHTILQKVENLEKLNEKENNQ